MKLEVYVVAEARRDAEVVRALTTRVASAKHATDVTVELVGPLAHVGGLRFLVWSDIPKALRQQKVRPWQGHFGKRAQAEDSAAAANALRLVREWLKDKQNRADFLILQRDADKKPIEKRRGLEQARGHEALTAGLKVVLGLANAKVEAWAICAVEPVASDVELHDRIAELRQQLGKDPRLCSHDLDASDPLAKSSAKRVLERLLGSGDEAFEPVCTTTPLGTLAERGQQNGLAEFLEELAQAV